MSVKVMGKVWELDLPHNQLLVLLSLADHADHDGNNVFPSLGLTAWKTGYSVQQVRRVMRELEKSGVLIATTRKAGTKTKYRIETSAGKVKPDYTPSKMSPVTKSNDHPLHSVTPTPYISPDDSMGINRPLEPSSNLPDGVDHVQSVKEKKQRAPNKNAPWHDELLRVFGLTPETVTNTGDKTYWIAAADLAKIEFPVEKIEPFYKWCANQKWSKFSVMAMAKHAGEWLAENNGEDDPFAKMFETAEVIGGKPWETQS